MRKIIPTLASLLLYTSPVNADCEKIKFDKVTIDSHKNIAYVSIDARCSGLEREQYYNVLVSLPNNDDENREFSVNNKGLVKPGFISIPFRDYGGNCIEDSPNCNDPIKKGQSITLIIYANGQRNNPLDTTTVTAK